VNSDIRILEVEPFYTVETAREPLKFGNVVVEECLFCHVRVRVENRSGKVAEGWGAIFLMDMWGWPTPKVAHPDREEAMRRLNGQFCQAAAQYPGYAHPVDIFRSLESDLAAMSNAVCAEMKLAEQMPFLAALIAAAPVGSQYAIDLLEPVADQVICPLVPADLMAVGLYYSDFGETSDQTVHDLLSREVE
jgi:hypothetical protein